jgi:hypothetical protein
VQVRVVAVVHVPELLHTDAVVALPFVQLAGIQTVELPGNVHVVAFVPSHWPVQPPDPAHAVRGLTGLPVMVVHVPTEPLAAHDWHCPVHAPSQQTPSTQ